MIDDLDRALGAVSNPHRRRIVDLLALRPSTVREAAAHVALSLPAIDRHLDMLVEAGVIQRRKRGRSTYLAIRREGLRVIRDWIGGYDLDWGADSETLDNYFAFLDREDDPTRKEQP